MGKRDDDDEETIDREAILSRRELLIALATTGASIASLPGPAAGQRRPPRSSPRPHPCLSAPIPLVFRQMLTIELAVGEVITAAQRRQIAGVARTWATTRRGTIWVQGHSRQGADAAERRFARERANVVAAELRRQHVLPSRIASHTSPPPPWRNVAIGAPPVLRARGVTVWLER